MNVWHCNAHIGRHGKVDVHLMDCRSLAEKFWQVETIFLKPGNGLVDIHFEKLDGSIPVRIFKRIKNGVFRKMSFTLPASMRSIAGRLTPARLQSVPQGMYLIAE